MWSNQIVLEKQRWNTTSWCPLVKWNFLKAWYLFTLFILSLDLRSSDVTGELKMAVEYWLLLMMNCLQSAGLIWTQIWKYCGSRLLLSNLKDPSCRLESVDLHPLPELMISPLKITLKRLIYLIKTLSWSEILILMPPIPRRTINIAFARAWIVWISNSLSLERPDQ